MCAIKIRNIVRPIWYIYFQLHVIDIPLWGQGCPKCSFTINSMAEQCIHPNVSHVKWHMFHVLFQMYLTFIIFLKLSLFFNYIGLWETSLLQGRPALYCRAELHCTALKGDMWHTPLSNPQSTIPKHPPHQKRKFKLLFSDLEMDSFHEYRQLSLLPKWGEELITLHLHSKAALLGLHLALPLSFLEASVGPSPSCPGKCRQVWAGDRCLLDTPVLGWPGLFFSFSSFTFSLSPSPGTWSHPKEENNL